MMATRALLSTKNDNFCFRSTKYALLFSYWVRIFLSIRTCYIDEVQLKLEIQNGHQEIVVVWKWCTFVFALDSTNMDRLIWNLIWMLRNITIKIENRINGTYRMSAGGHFELFWTICFSWSLEQKKHFYENLQRTFTCRLICICWRFC